MHFHQYVVWEHESLAHGARLAYPPLKTNPRLLAP